jgi:hypothetical protein
MHTGKRSDCRMVLDDYMTGKRCGIRHDDVIAKQTIMANMCIGHQEIVISDTSIAPTPNSSSMDVYIFAKNIVIADGKKRFFALEFKILRLETNRRKRVKLIGFSNSCWTLDNNVRLETTSFPDPNTRTNIAIRSYPGVISDFCFGTDNGRRVDHGC